MVHPSNCEFFRHPPSASTNSLGVAGLEVDPVATGPSPGPVPSGRSLPYIGASPVHSHAGCCAPPHLPQRCHKYQGHKDWRTPKWVSRRTLCTPPRYAAGANRLDFDRCISIRNLTRRQFFSGRARPSDLNLHQDLIHGLSHRSSFKVDKATVRLPTPVQGGRCSRFISVRGRG